MLDLFHHYKAWCTEPQILNSLYHILGKKWSVLRFCFCISYSNLAWWWLLYESRNMWLFILNPRNLFTNITSFSFFLSFGAAAQRRPWPHSRGFLDHTQRRNRVGRTPLDEWSARRRDLYLAKHNTHNRQTSMPPVGFEPTISAGERPQTYALDRAATGIAN